jgi:quinol monooxygenase YgiN
MGQVVIAAYRPKPGQEKLLLEVVRTHVPILRQQKLATARPVQVLRASDGTLLEIFEWVSEEAVEKAHTDPVVKRLWERFGKVSDFATLATLPGAQEPFPHFEPVDL